MKHTTKYGRIGENIAKQYLFNKGYKIHSLNYKINYNEIDIIAKHNKYLVFIEVKTRLSSSFGPAEDQLIRKKRGRLHKAIGRFMAVNAFPENLLKFEFIAINLDISNNLANIKHYFNVL